MPGILIYLIPIFLTLGAAAIDKSNAILKQYYPEILTALGAVGLTLTDILSNSQEIFVSTYTWGKSK
jgi:hypothetical protein